MDGKRVKSQFTMNFIYRQSYATSPKSNSSKILPLFILITKLAIISHVFFIIWWINNHLLIVKHLYADAQNPNGIPNANLLAFIIEDGKSEWSSPAAFNCSLLHAGCKFL